MIDFDSVRQRMKEYVVDAENREEHAEVHTPWDMIDDMLGEIPDRKFEDPEATFLDPCAGIGNFPLAIAERLVENGIPYEHAMEKQVYMVEIQPKNCVMIERLLNPTGELNLNLKCCDTLELDIEAMKPSDWRSERFRTDYGNQYTFFERKSTEAEMSRLTEIENLTDDESILQHFRRGYM